MDTRNRFDRKYKTNPKSFSTDPPPVVIGAAGLMTGNSVLELGVGNGRNATYLLNKSIDVTGVDVSQEGIDLLRENTGSNPNLQLICSDVLNFETDKQYDLILAIGLFHFLGLDEISKLLGKMVDWTKPGALHAIAVRMTQNNRNDLPHVFSNNELRSMYEKLDWKVEYYKETNTDNHKVASIIARKPQ